MMDKLEVKYLLLYLLKQFEIVCDKAKIIYYASGGTCLGAIRHKGMIPWDDDIDVMMSRKDYDLFVDTCNNVLPEPVVIRTRENDPYFCGEYIKLCYKDDVKVYSDLSIDVFFLDNTDPNRKLFRSLQNRLLLDLYFIKKYKVSKMKKGPDYIPNSFIRRCQVSLLSVLPIGFIDRTHKRIMMAEKNETDYLVNWGSCYSYKKATYNRVALGTPVNMPFENTSIMVAEHPEELLTQLYGPGYMTPPPVEKRTNHGVSPLRCASLDMKTIKEEIGEL